MTAFLLFQSGSIPPRLHSIKGSQAPALVVVV